MVEQSAGLMSGTIAYNIGYGASVTSEDTLEPSPAAIQAAAEQVYIHHYTL